MGNQVPFPPRPGGRRLPASVVYLAGEYTAAESASIPMLSGAFLYGEGVFTTLRLYRGQPWDLDGHLARLRDNARHLDLICPPDLDELAAILDELVERNGLAASDSRARITVCRGGHPDRLMLLDNLASVPVLLGVFLFPLPSELSAWQERGIAVVSLEAGTDRGALAALKSICYLPSVLALRRAAAAGCQEALLVDTSGQVLEGATSNVFTVRADGSLTTPPAAGGLLAGRTRARVIALARARGLEVVESSQVSADLARSPEVFMTGSVKEIVPVVSVDGKIVGNGTPGPVTRRLQIAYRQNVADVLAAAES